MSETYIPEGPEYGKLSLLYRCMGRSFNNTTQHTTAVATLHILKKKTRILQKYREPTLDLLENSRLGLIEPVQSATILTPQHHSGILLYQSP